MDPRIKILDSVYRELCVVLTEFEEKLYNSRTDEEKNFFADFKKILAIVESRSTYEEAVVDLKEEELTYYYGIMKEFVDLLTVRLLKAEEAVPVEATVTKAKGLMGAWLVKTDRTHTLHYIWPTESRRITWYHCNAHPLGIDIGGTVRGRGEPVCAIIGGILTTVADTWSESASGSSYVIISGDDGREYRYAHMVIYDDIKGKFKEVNKRVEAGRPLGQMSDKGASNNVHLHLEIRENDIPANPLDFFPNIAVENCDNDEASDKRNERVLIYQAPEGDWSYEENGRFKAKSGATLSQLDKYVEHKDLTWKDAVYEDSVRKIKSDVLRVGDVVYFLDEDISVAEIEAKLKGLGYEVDSDEQEDISGFIDTGESAKIEVNQATQGTDLGNWIYLEDGKFQVKSTSRLWQLDQYVAHKGLAWTDAEYDGDPDRKVIATELRAGEVMCFPSEKISVAEIETRLAELGYVVQEKAMPETDIESVSVASANAGNHDGQEDSSLLSRFIDGGIDLAGDIWESGKDWLGDIGEGIAGAWDLINGAGVEDLDDYGKEIMKITLDDIPTDYDCADVALKMNEIANKALGVDDTTSKIIANGVPLGESDIPAIYSGDFANEENVTFLKNSSGGILKDLQSKEIKPGTVIVMEGHIITVTAILGRDDNGFPIGLNTLQGSTTGVPDFIKIPNQADLDLYVNEVIGFAEMNNSGRTGSTEEE